MDKQSEPESLEHCLAVQLTRTIHQLRHGSAAQQSLEQSAASLSTLYQPEAIQAACERMLSDLPPALADTQVQLEALGTLTTPSAIAATSGPSNSTYHLNLLSERVSLLWGLNDLDSATTDFNRLLDTTPASYFEHTSVLWQIYNLLSVLTLDNNNLSLSRTMTMQAMLYARDLEDTEKVERSEFSLASTLSTAENANKLKDNFVALRSGVLGGQSHLPIYQQHLVLLNSARDFCRRNMRASAEWTLEIAEEYTAQMLPPELAVFHQVKRHFSDQSDQAQDTQPKTKNQSTSGESPKILSSEKKQRLDSFIEQSNEASTILRY